MTNDVSHPLGLVSYHQIPLYLYQQIPRTLSTLYDPIQSASWSYVSHSKSLDVSLGELTSRLIIRQVHAPLWGISSFLLKSDFLWPLDIRLLTTSNVTWSFFSSRLVGPSRATCGLCNISRAFPVRNPHPDLTVLSCRITSGYDMLCHPWSVYGKFNLFFKSMT